MSCYLAKQQEVDLQDEQSRSYYFKFFYLLFALPDSKVKAIWGLKGKRGCHFSTELPYRNDTIAYH